MMHYSTLLLPFALGAFAQTSQYVDSATGITFEGYQDDDTGYRFGMALPEDPGADFIGQLTVLTNGSGYGAIDLGSAMTEHLLIVAWANGDEVMSSLREATGYSAPPVYSGDYSPTLTEISNGTYVNSTAFVYTFVCSGCITNDTLTFDSNGTTVPFGWAVSSTAVSDTTSTSASLSFHDVGYGDFVMNLTDSYSAKYATWASWATASTTSSSSTGSSNSTCTSTASNITTTTYNATFDYIVAGAGPAGIIAAERIAESGASVLLIERGEDSTYATGGRSTMEWNDTTTQYDVPAMGYWLTDASDTSEYCTDVASMAGCILGGGTMVNAMMFVRPQEADFSNWPAGWQWSDIEASAERLYSRNPGTTLSSSDSKRYDQGVFTLLSGWLNSTGWSQVDAIESPNEKTKVYSYPPWDIQNGTRAGPVKTYLPLAKTYSNFQLMKNTFVVRAIRSGSTVTGVEVENSSGSRQIINLNTNGRVILAAGSLSTPRILFNSGIGPTEQIQTVASGVSCTGVTLPSESDWIELPVGESLRDHPIYTLTFNTTSNVTELYQDAIMTSPSQTNIDLYAQGSGPLAQSNQRLIFWTSQTTANGTRYFQGTCSSPDAGQVKIKIYLTHGATSSGSLGISSAGATEFITQPWMNTDADKAAVATLLDDIISMAQNSSYFTFEDTTLSGSSMVSNADYVSGDHFLGTAKIQSSNDTSDAVVDTNAQVIGMDNLFIVDASIHPDLPTGNTQAIVMVVAEHAISKILALDTSTAATGSGSSSNTSSTSIAVASSTMTSSAVATAAVSTVGSETSAVLTSSASAPTKVCKRKKNKL